MIVALIDSGLGMLPTGAWLRKLRPDLDLMLLLDPDGAPWGPKSEQWVIDRVVGTARNAVADGAEVVVLPCNTASVTALDHVRADLGDVIPVIGTVPAIKPAAAAAENVAIWATAATTASRYQADLIAKFAVAPKWWGSPAMASPTPSTSVTLLPPPPRSMPPHRRPLPTSRRSCSGARTIRWSRTRSRRGSAHTFACSTVPRRSQRRPCAASTRWAGPRAAPAQCGS